MRAVNLLVVRPAAAALLIGVALVGGCYHTRSLGHVPGDEAIVEQEALGRTTRYLLDVDDDTSIEVFEGMLPLEAARRAATLTGELV